MLTLWMAVGLYLSATPEGPQLTPDAMYFQTQVQCEEFLAKTVTPYLDGEGVVVAYGLKCVEIVLKPKEGAPPKPQEFKRGPGIVVPDTHRA